MSTLTRRTVARVVLVLGFCASAVAGESLDRAPVVDSNTLLLMRFDEPDEAITITEALTVDPIFVRMEAVHQRGRFGGALKFVGRRGLRQCVLVPLPQPVRRVRHTSRKDPNRFADVKVPLVLMDNSRGYTIEFWVFPQALQDQTMVAGINSGTFVPRAAWQIDLTDKGAVRFACGAGLHRFETESGRKVRTGEWSHVAVVNDRGKVQIVVNGSAAGDAVAMERAALQRVTEAGSDGTAICVGGPGPEGEGGFFDGLIDELRLSTVARSYLPDPAATIDSRKELFLDDYLLARLTGVRRVVNQPERYTGNPLLRPKGEWEALALQPLGVLYDPRLGLFRAWYRAFNREDSQASMCYAYSRDGLRWVQPELGLAEYGGSTRNNIVAPRRSMFVFLDPLARPGEGNICATAKTNYGSGGGTFRQVLMRSPDGVQWPWGEVEGNSGYQGWPYSRIRDQESIMATDRPLITDPTYFAKLDKLVIIDKEGEADQLKPPQWARIGWDLGHWQDPVLTELKKTEKNNQAWYGIKTHDEESVLVGITDAYHGQKPGRWIDFQLVCSRDGYNWQHVADQETFFPLGPQGSWDEGMVIYAQPVEPPGSDKISIYYTGSKVRHDTFDVAKPEQLPIYNMGVAFLRRDGYVSLENDGTSREGVVETRPIRFTGRHLFVNADASQGAVEVELCRVSGVPYEGFARIRARPLNKDLVRHLVRWDQTADVSGLAGKLVVVKFYLQKGAKLYSYRFGKRDPHAQNDDAIP